MTFSQSEIANSKTIVHVCELYRRSSLTQEAIAEEVGITPASVHEIVNRNISPKERKSLKSVRYRLSKLGHRNPMLGQKPGNYLGQCEDGHGYLTEVLHKKRYFVHRIVMAELLRLHPCQLPSNLDVHHMDRNRRNNSPHNLALCNKAGHRAMHQLELRGFPPPFSVSTEFASRIKTNAYRTHTDEPMNGGLDLMARAVMANMLGLHLSLLPEWLVVHRIDGNIRNNSPDNLALVTRAGYKILYRLISPDAPPTLTRLNVLPLKLRKAATVKPVAC